MPSTVRRLLRSSLRFIYRFFSPSRSATKKVNINDYLSPEVINLVFRRIGLRELCHANRVCRRWASQQAYACTSRSSLTLLVGTGAMELIHDSGLVIPHADQLVEEDGTPIACGDDMWLLKNSSLQLAKLDEDTVNKVYRLMPDQVTSLAISFRNCPFTITEHLLTLLRLYSPTLTSLKLWCDYHYDDFRHVLDGDPRWVSHFVDLVQAINSLPKLKHLTFYFNNTIDENILHDGRPNLYFSILSQLEEFCSFVRIVGPSTPEIIKSSLIRYGKYNQQLTNIALLNDIPYNLLSDRLLKRRFTGLYFTSFTILIIANMPFLSNLTSLTVSLSFLDESQIDLLAEALVPLTKLVYLQILGLVGGELVLSPKFQDWQSVPRMRSVKVLSWNYLIYEDINAELLPTRFNWLFPNVQVIQLSLPFSTKRRINDLADSLTISMPSVRLIEAHNLFGDRLVTDRLD